MEIAVGTNYATGLILKNYFYRIKNKKSIEP